MRMSWGLLLVVGELFRLANHTCPDTLRAEGRLEDPQWLCPIRASTGSRCGHRPTAPYQVPVSLLGGQEVLLTKGQRSTLAP